MITEFLLARFAEDEAAIVEDGHAIDCEDAYGMHLLPERAHTEREAKRRIVELHQRCNVHDRPGDECDACQRCGDGSIWPCDTLLAVASVYADHPDFRDEWRLTW